MTAAAPTPLFAVGRCEHPVAGVVAVIIGAFISTMGCYYGMRSEGGAEGVGVATTHAVVASCLLILVVDYLLASFLFRVLFA